MNRLKRNLLKLIDRCRKSEIAYASAARYCESGNLIALFKAHALERAEYQNTMALVLDKIGYPLYKSKRRRFLFYEFWQNLLNWLNNTNDISMLNRCLAADQQLYVAYEETIDELDEEFAKEKLRQQFNETRKAIQELTVVKETVKH